MKKIYLLPLFLLTLFVRVNKVNALDVTFSDFYSDYSFLATLEDNYYENINVLLSYYDSNLSQSYPYYVINIGTTSNHTVLSYIEIIPYNSTDVCSVRSNSVSYYSIFADCNGQSHNQGPTYRYSISSDSYSLLNTSVSFRRLLYTSNFSLVFKGATNSNDSSDSITITSYSNLDYNVSFPLLDISIDDTIPTYTSLTNGQPSADFTEVDMSQYDYIILSLRDYDVNTFNTTIYSLGRLCFTPVYDYGMRQKDTYYNAYKTKACTEYYNSLTPVSVYIIQADIDNHAVYYIKRYENETNILKIPTSIFDITYVTSQNASDPQVEIGGRSYPAIPYNQLTDTANISTSEGYISGQVCPLGDVNCEYENGIGLDISDIFTQPLRVLQSVWTGITTFFTLIANFITLIPSPLREFLYASFMLSIILGLIKIIIG